MICLKDGKVEYIVFFFNKFISAIFPLTLPFIVLFRVYSSCPNIFALNNGGLCWCTNLCFHSRKLFFIYIYNFIYVTFLWVGIKLTVLWNDTLSVICSHDLLQNMWNSRSFLFCFLCGIWKYSLFFFPKNVHISLFAFLITDISPSRP